MRILFPVLIIFIALNPFIGFAASTYSKTISGLDENEYMFQEQPDFYFHKVKKKQTLFSISRQYNVSVEEIIRLNPEVAKGLDKGMLLKIPVIKDEPKEVEIKDSVKINSEENKSRISGTNYFMYKVIKGDTFFRLEQKYGVSQEELIKLNPVLKNGLIADISIKIPAGNIPVFKPTATTDSAFLRYEVKKGETLYGISTKFKIRIDDIKKFNPRLMFRGLQAGDILLIPGKTNNEEDALDFDQVKKEIYQQQSKAYAELIPEGCKGEPDTTRIFKVGLLLPLFLEANDTVNFIRLTAEDLMNDSAFVSQWKPGQEIPEDSLIEREEKIIYPATENFLQFYEGVLLAVDRIQQEGMKIELNVFDTAMDSMLIDSLIRSEVLIDMDLIIGPIFPEEQKEIAAIAAKNRIPMVSPLSSGGEYELTNPYYFKINPVKDYLVRKTADFITNEYFDKNFIVLRMEDPGEPYEDALVNLCREKLFATGQYGKMNQLIYHEYNFNDDKFWGLSRILDKDRENVFIVPSKTEAQVSVAVSNINTAAEKYDVTLVGLSNFQRYKSIQPEYFHQTKLRVLSPYFVDYSKPLTNRFIDKYRSNYSAEPSLFSFQGYDVAYYFLSALYRFGDDFRSCIPTYQMELNQLVFNFQKVNRMGGYMNNGLFIVGYEKNFDVKNLGFIGINPFLLHKN